MFLKTHAGGVWIGWEGKNQRLRTREEGDSGPSRWNGGGRRTNHGLADKDKQQYSRAVKRSSATPGLSKEGAGQEQPTAKRAPPRLPAAPTCWGQEGEGTKW